MQIPLQISFHSLDRSEALEADVREHALKLEEFCDRILSCHVVLEKPHRHQHHGNVFHVRIRVAVPRRQLIVDHETALDHAHEDPYVTVRDAFKAMRRQVEDYVRELRGDVKTHSVPAHGRVKRLLPDQDYGLIETPEGRDIYFHSHSVLDNAFDDLEIGMEVHFVEEAGDKGPQASTVRPVSRRRPRHDMAGKPATYTGTRGDGAQCATAVVAKPVATARTKSRNRAEATPIDRPSQTVETAPDEVVRLRAYEHWEAAGRPPGDGVQFWLEAEQELSQSH